MAEREFAFDSEFLKKLEYLYIVSKKLIRAQWKGERRSFQMGSSVEFRDYRNYVAGDDLRHLDWNIFKRLGKLLIKLYEEEQEHYVYILLDISQSMDFGSPNKLTYGKKVAAALAYLSLAHHDRVFLASIGENLGEFLPQLRGKGQIFNVFRFLEKLKSRGETHLNRSLQNFSHRVKRRGIAIIISDFLDGEGYELGLKRLAYQRMETHLIQILDRAEVYPSHLAGDLRLVDVETGDVKEVAVTDEVLVNYSAAFLEYCEEIRRFAYRHSMTYFRTFTSLAFEDLILQMFRRGGLVK